MKGFDTNLRLQASSSPSLEFSNGFLPKRQSFLNLNFRNSCPRSFSPTMLKLLSSSASRAHHLTPAIRVGSAQVESPLFKALSQLTGWNRRSTSLGHRVFFCSEPTDGAAEAEAKTAESDSEGSDSKSSSAIVPTNPRPEDCLTVSLIVFKAYEYQRWCICICFIVSLAIQLSRGISIRVEMSRKLLTFVLILVEMTEQCMVLMRCIFNIFVLVVEKFEASD